MFRTEIPQSHPGPDRLLLQYFISLGIPAVLNDVRMVGYYLRLPVTVTDSSLDGMNCEVRLPIPAYVELFSIIVANFVFF